LAAHAGTPEPALSVQQALGSNPGMNEEVFTRSRHIAVGFIFVLLLIAGLVLFALSQMGHMQAQLDSITQQHNKKADQLNGLKEGIRKRQIGLRNLIVAQDPFEKDDIRNLFYVHALEAAEARNGFAAMELSSKEKESLDRLNASMRVAYPMQNSLAEKAIFESNINALSDELKATFNVQAVVMRHLNDIINLLKTQTQDAFNDAHASYNKSIYLVAVLGSSALLLGLFIAAYVFRTARLQEDMVNEAMEQLSSSADTLEIRVKKRTRELEEAKQLAEMANEEKSRFLARMSHELRTPLNAVIGFTQLIEEDIETGGDTSHHRDSLQHVTRAGLHLLNLVNDALDLAQIEEGEMEYNITDVNLSAEIDENLKLILPLAQKNNISVIFDPAEFKGVCVRADDMRLKQVLLNLFSNGIKYNNNGGKLIIHPGTGPDGKFRLNITDTGNGIKKEDFGVLFKPFSRLYLDASSMEGTGIGLTISKQLIERMGGSIGVESTPGIGSTFWLELEMGASCDNDVQQGNMAVSQDRFELSRSSTVLYIEDNLANIALVRKALASDPNITLLSAETPTIGLQMAHEYQPDLILLDICLPEMDGYAVQEQLQQHAATQNIPIVALSAGAMPHEVEKGLDAGFRDYLTKPVDIYHLRKTLQRELYSET
jgi:signal transduction histidine kinase/ActR/RegA family two-component response regulator